MTSACQKASNQQQKDQTADVSFSITNILQGDVKSTLTDPPPGISLKDRLAVLTITGPSYPTATAVNLEVYNIGSASYTKSLKLIPGSYTISEFLIYGKQQSGVRTLLTATPHQGSHNATFLRDPGAMALNKNFTIEAFSKKEVSIEVVSYQPQSYDNFGFIYYKQDDIVDKQLYFSGHLCIKDINEYRNTDYMLQPGGLKPDLPAIFKIRVKRNGVYQAPDYTNDVAPDYGAGGPLLVEYGDFKNLGDVFQVELWVFVRCGRGCEFKLFKTWTFNDISNISTGADNVVDFVVGNCNVPAADYHFQSYLNLPTLCTYHIDRSGHAANLGEYLDVRLSNFSPAGTYDMRTGPQPSYCADHANKIAADRDYTMQIVSSLYPKSIPKNAPAKNFDWYRMNWLINHLDWFPGYAWEDVQAAIWRLNNSWTGPAEDGVSYSTTAQEMYADMIADGDGFTPLRGGWAFVIFTDPDPGDAGTLYCQSVVIKVDQ